MKIRVTSINAGDPVLAHQHGGVEAVHEVSAEICDRTQQLGRQLDVPLGLGEDAVPRPVALPLFGLGRPSVDVANREALYEVMEG